jgi:hypothetical protein
MTMRLSYYAHMNTTTVLRVGIPSDDQRPPSHARRNANGVVTSFYPEPALRNRLERELGARRHRDGQSAWSMSSVVADILREHFGMARPGDGDGPR